MDVAAPGVLVAVAGSGVPVAVGVRVGVLVGLGVFVGDGVRVPVLSTVGVGVGGGAFGSGPGGFSLRYSTV